MNWQYRPEHILMFESLFSLVVMWAFVNEFLYRDPIEEFYWSSLKGHS
jgi:hypothetical protein